MPKILLICLIGLPRSGKTTWAGKQGYPIVCPDAIRLALHGQRYDSLAEPFVWAIAKCMVRALFLAGHKKVIVDDTNGSRKRRDFWQDDAWDTVFHVIGTSKDECIRRACKQNDDGIIPVIERMSLEHASLEPDEDIYQMG